MDLPDVYEMEVEKESGVETKAHRTSEGVMMSTSGSFDSAFGGSEGCSQSSETSRSSTVGDAEYRRSSQDQMAPPAPSPMRSLSFYARSSARRRSPRYSGNRLEPDISPKNLFGNAFSPSARPAAMRKSRSPWVDVSQLVSGKILVEDTSFLGADDLDHSVRMLSLENNESMDMLKLTGHTRKRAASPAQDQLGVGSASPLAKRFRADANKTKSCEEFMMSEKIIEDGDGPNVPKPREAHNPIMSTATFKKLRKGHSLADAVVMTALELGSDPNVVGDCTKNYILPTLTAEEARSQDLKEISPQTLIDLLNGQYRDTVNSYHIVDCRYPYEYKAGHITTSMNLYTEKMVSDFFLPTMKPVLEEAATAKRTIIIFHCEFSAERGPGMCRRLRAWDRNINISCFPRLNYPELYILNGGYRRFYMEGPLTTTYCIPFEYQPMSDAAKTAELKFYKSQASADFLGKDHGKKQERVGVRPSRPVSRSLLRF